MPTKFIFGVDIFFTAILAAVEDVLLLDAVLSGVFAVGVRIFTAEDATEEFTVLLLVDIFEAEAVGLEADVDVEEVAWVTTFGSVEGMGLPSLVCNFTTCKNKEKLIIPSTYDNDKNDVTQSTLKNQYN